MPLGMFHYLHSLSLNESRNKDGKENKAAEYVSDELEELM